MFYTRRGTLSVAALAQIRAGKLNALPVTSTKRRAILPDVPTFEESGYPGLLSNTFYGLLGPAGLSHEVVMRLNAAVVAAVARKEFADQLVALGYELESNTPAKFAAFLRDDGAQWLRLIKRPARAPSSFRHSLLESAERDPVGVTVGSERSSLPSSAAWD